MFRKRNIAGDSDKILIQDERKETLLFPSYPLSLITIPTNIHPRMEISVKLSGPVNLQIQPSDPNKKEYLRPFRSFIQGCYFIIPLYTTAIDPISLKSLLKEKSSAIAMIGQVSIGFGQFYHRCIIDKSIQGDQNDHSSNQVCRDWYQFIQDQDDQDDQKFGRLCKHSELKERYYLSKNRTWDQKEFEKDSSLNPDNIVDWLHVIQRSRSPPKQPKQEGFSEKIPNGSKHYDCDNIGCNSIVDILNEFFKYTQTQMMKGSNKTHFEYDPPFPCWEFGILLLLWSNFPFPQFRNDIIDYVIILLERKSINILRTPDDHNIINNAFQLFEKPISIVI